VTTLSYDPARRADLGGGRGDVTVKSSTITATVHRLGAQDTVAAKLQLIDATDTVLASAPVPAPKASTDL
jgi:hypothetical protein